MTFNDAVSMRPARETTNSATWSRSTLGCTTVGTKPYELMYFWFAVGVNVVWIVVPLLMLRHAVKQNVSMRTGPAAGARKGGKSKRA